MPSYEKARGGAWDEMQRIESVEHSKQQVLQLTREITRLKEKIASKNYTLDDENALENKQKRIALHERTLKIAAERHNGAKR